MINAQEWLDKNYPSKTTNEIKREHFSEIISGELVIEDFPNLERIDVSVIRKGRLTKLKIINCPKLCKLKCSNNKLEELDIDRISYQQLQKLDCKNNKLNRLKFHWMNPKKLTYLDISKNSFSSQNLDNLKVLGLKDSIKNLYVDNNKIWNVWLKSSELSLERKIQEDWEGKGFNCEQVKEWLDIGLQPTEAKFAQWLRDKKEIGPEFIRNYNWGSL